VEPWSELIRWLYGDALQDTGFWYGHPLAEIKGLSDDELFWVPDATSLCLLWHVGHIAHRERLHVAHLIQGQEAPLVPAAYEAFGTEWCSAGDLRQTVGSSDEVKVWVDGVRQESARFISSLTDKDLHRPAARSPGFTVAQWLLITVSHGALHIGKIQALRHMLKGSRDNPC
jgi:hypothetical protein